MEQLEASGATIGYSQDRLRLVPGSLVPPELVEVIRNRKTDLMGPLLVMREARRGH